METDTLGDNRKIDLNLRELEAIADLVRTEKHLGDEIAISRSYGASLRKEGAHYVAAVEFYDKTGAVLKVHQTTVTRDKVLLLLGWDRMDWDTI